MGKGFWLGLGIVGGAVGVGVALALEQEPVAATVRTVASTVAASAERGARRVVQTVSGVKQLALDNIAKHHIWELLTKHGDRVPPAVAAAIIDIETRGEFEPTIYNYGLPGGGYGVAYATPGAPPVAKWMRPGDGGFAHNPHAVSLFQILDYWRLENGKKTGTPSFAGYPLPLLNDMINPEKNIAAGLKNLNVQWARIRRLMPKLGGAEFWTALYYAHNQGGGAFEQIAKADAGSVKGLIKNARHLAVAVQVALRVPVWAALAPASAGGGA
jgi:hypothetical protein